MNDGHKETHAEQFEAYRKKLHALVEQHGWAVQVVAFESPLHYTVGLTRAFSHPELAVRGLPLEMGQAILNSIAIRIREGESFKAGTIHHDIFKGLPAKFIAVSNHEATLELKAARDYAEEGRVGALQLLWPDAQGLFPDDAAASNSARQAQSLADDGQ